MDCRSLMRRAAKHFAGKTAIVHGEKRLAFAEAWMRGLVPSSRTESLWISGS